MDYFSIIILVVVTFVFISDRNVKSISEIKKDKISTNIVNKVNNIKENLDIIQIKTKDMKYINISKSIQKTTKQYILLQNNKLKLNECDVDTLIANYIISDEIPCGFNILYVYKCEKWSLKKIYIDIINYLNIFNKTDVSTYGVIICKKEDFSKDERDFKRGLISYIPTEATHVIFDKENTKTINFKSIYAQKIKEANISIIIRILLLIISGSIITTNLIYSILNVNNNINGLIISAVIYYCYLYIIKYIYKPIGKQRIIATYIFPVYFIIYIIVGVNTLCSKVIKKVQAS